MLAIGFSIGRINDNLRRAFPRLWSDRRWQRLERFAARFYDRMH
jgi:hypothetical protein